MINLGIILCFVATMAWTFTDAFMGYAVASLNVNPIMLTAISQVCGGGILLIFAGPGQLAIKTIRSAHTWAHGLLSILTTSCYTFALVYITATEVNFIMRIDVIFVLLMSAIFLNKKIYRSDWIGMALVGVGIFLFASGLEPMDRTAAITMCFFSAFFLTLRTLESETHPTSIEARHDVKHRCRVTGMILFITGTMFLLSYTLLAYFIGHTSFGDAALGSALVGIIPPTEQLLNIETVVASVAIGCTVLALAYFFMLYSNVVAGAAQFLTVLTILPYTTYAVEWTMAQFGLVDVSHIQPSDLLVGLLIVVGGMYMVIARQKRESQIGSKVIPEPAE